MKTKTKDAKPVKKKAASTGAKGKAVKAKSVKTGKKPLPKKAPVKTSAKTKIKTKTTSSVKSPAPVKTSPVKKTNGKTIKELKATLEIRAIEKGAAIKSEQEKKQKKYKPNRKTRYTAKELLHFKNIIIEERDKIIESAKANMESLVDDESGEYVGDNLTYASHMAEQGSDEMEREKNYMFVQRDEKYLGYLQEALVRIDQGTYGVCIECRETTKNLCRTCPLIPGERLELVPITQHCIECKNLRG